MSQGYASCCVHTHCNFCDGKDSPAEVAKQALADGIKHLGFTSHAHTPVPEDAGGTLPADSSAYRAEILRLREQYAGRMEILCGMEWDAQADVPYAPWDYWIGSVHHVSAAGKCYPVDWKAACLERCRDEAFSGDIYAVAEAYFAQVAWVAAQKPSILGHIDLLCKLNGDGVFFDEAHPRYRAAALAALEAAHPAETLLEINTGAMARGYRASPYPADFLLRRWRERGGQVILTADAHAKEQLLFGMETAAKAARQAGFSACCILTSSGLQSVAL